MDQLLASILRNQSGFHPLVPLDANTEKIAPVDLTAHGELPEHIAADSTAFSAFMHTLRTSKQARYLFGGYDELRMMYGRSSLFSNKEEPRRLHIGLDIWGEAGTEVFAFWGGMVHSIGWNDQLGDYGATIILLHQLDGIPFYTLYGHLSKRDIESLSPGQYLTRGQVLGHFGEPWENGQWPPHLHFQLIRDMGLYSGDFPGVVKESERLYWLELCPDPNLIAQLKK